MFKPFAALSLVVLAGCATVPVAEDAPIADGVLVNELPPQQLAAGTCGVFGWSTSETPIFTFFATEDSAKYFDEGRVLNLAPEGEAFPARAYSGPVDLRLEMGAGEPMIGGTRHRDARLRVLRADGWEKLVPIAAITSCQS